MPAVVIGSTASGTGKEREILCTFLPMPVFELTLSGVNSVCVIENDDVDENDDNAKRRELFSLEPPPSAAKRLINMVGG